MVRFILTLGMVEIEKALLPSKIIVKLIFKYIKIRDNDFDDVL